jgi:hypothetical protein
MYCLVPEVDHVSVVEGYELLWHGECSLCADLCWGVILEDFNLLEDFNSLKTVDYRLTGLFETLCILHFTCFLSSFLQQFIGLVVTASVARLHPWLLLF